MKSIFNNTFFSIIVFSFLLSSCNQKDEVVEEENSEGTPFSSQYTLSDLSESFDFVSEGIPVGLVDLKEASGLAESRMNSNSLWVHNDQGNDNVIYLMDKSSGNIKAAYLLNGIKNKDWEDIEVGPGPDDHKSYIYLADIGDNDGEISKRTVYRFEEPVYDEAQENQIIEWTGIFDALNFTYPEGPRDAETLLLDHQTKDLYLLSKRDIPSRLYLFPYPQNTETITTLQLKGTLPLLLPVAGNVSPTGKEILIKTPGSIFYWKHRGGALWETLAIHPFIAPYNPVEPQGEAVCFDEKGGYFTVSEKVKDKEVILYYYSKKE